MKYMLSHIYFEALCQGEISKSGYNCIRMNNTIIRHTVPTLKNLVCLIKGVKKHFPIENIPPPVGIKTGGMAFVKNKLGYSQCSQTYCDIH